MVYLRKEGWERILPRPRKTIRQCHFVLRSKFLTPHGNEVCTLRPLIVGGLIKKRGLAIFPEEINGEGVNKWKWVDFVMQC